jgi:hypothetical protein
MIKYTNDISYQPEIDNKMTKSNQMNNNHKAE